MTAPKENSDWWSNFAIEVGQGLQWELGSCRLTAFRHEGEWQLAHECGSSEETGPGTSRVTTISEAPPEAPELKRFAASRATNIIKLLPRAADRSVVAKPYPPLHLLAADETKIYISSPAWLEVTVGKRHHKLCELPARTLSDTWFGPNTREGDVAYALRTRARVQLAEMPMRTYRIITPVTIRNDGQDTLLIDRMNLPVPFLSVYSSQDGFLWTESVTLTRSQEAELASLKIGKGPPREAVGTERLSEPRQVSDPSFLVQAFTSLFTSFQEGN